MLLSQKELFLRFHGNVCNPYYIGTNNLIKKGAHLTTDYRDIIKNIPEFSKRKRQIVSKKISQSIDIKYKEIYSFLTNEFYSIDKIAEITGKPVREVINEITLMEIEGLVEFEIGKGYRRKEF